MRILTDPLGQNIETISATNATSNYPASNLVHPYLRKRFQASGNSSVITITYDSTYDIDCFFFGIHNIDTVSAVFKDSGGTPIDTISITTGNAEDVGVEYFTTLSAVKSIVITITTLGTYLMIGGLDFGEYYQVPGSGFLNDYPLNINNKSKTRKSRGGQSITDEAAKLRSYSFSFVEQLDIDIQDQLLNKKSPLYVDIFEGNNVKINRGYFDVNIPQFNKLNRRYSTRINLEEAL